jgi:hypothetical protein
LFLAAQLETTVDGTVWVELSNGHYVVRC